MSLKDQGILKQLIKISDDEKFITYKNYHRPRIYTYPEEKVQAETFLKLVLDYGYKPERIRMYESVKMGSDTREADIIVFNDDACEEPHILVECKKPDVGDSVDIDHLIPLEADQSFRRKLTRVFRAKLTTLVA